MDPTQLLQALQYSNGKTGEEIRMAEEFLQQARTSTGYIPSLLVIACNAEVNILVRQAAIVNLHTCVKRLWKKKPETGPNDLSGDKQTLKENILEAIIKCTDASKIYKEMIEIIKRIAKFDFPNNWESFLPNVIEKLKNCNNFQEVYGSLLALSALFENYKHLFKDTVKLESLVENTFGLLEAFAQKLLDEYELQAATAMHAILKIFSIATNIIMPKYLTNEKNLETWMTFFKVILDKNVHADLESLTEDHKVIAHREKNIYWRNKKICARVLAHYINKYRDVKNNRKEHKEFSKLFMGNYATPFLKSFMEILHRKKDHYLGIKVQFYSMKYIERCLKESSMRILLQEHLEFLLFDILIPAMFLTYKDNEDWEENPIEYIRNEEDIMERPNNLKIIASDMLQRITAKEFTIERTKAGTMILIKFMEHAAHILTTNTDPRTNQQADPRLKEAILRIIGCIYSSITCNKEIRQQIQILLEKFVIPEFKNELGAIRSRACWLFGMYGGMKFEGDQIIQVATEGLYNCILDRNLPVKVQAALALERVLKHEAAREILKPGLGQIFKIYLDLIEKVDHDHLVEALEGIIQRFGNDIAPFAVDLIRHFGSIFEKNACNDGEEGAGGEENDDDNEEERELAASGCLSAIANILKCKVSSEAIIESQDILVPLLQFTLTNDSSDDVEGGLKILGSIVYILNEIPEKFWVFFLELNYMLSGKPEAAVAKNTSNLSEEERILLQQKVDGWATDYITQILPCLQNYIQKGRNVIFTARDPYFNLTYIELLFKTINKIYENCYKRKTDFNMAIMSHLYITVIENYPKEIDNLMSFFLDIVIEHLPRSRSEMMAKSLIQLVATSIWYDHKATFQYLQEKGATEFVFKKWIELLPTFKHHSETLRVIIGLSSVFRANVNDIPQVVVESLPGLIKELIDLTTKVTERRTEEEFEDFDDDEEGDGDEDDEGDGGRRGGHYGALNTHDLKLMEHMKRMDKIHAKGNNKQVEDGDGDSDDDGEGADGEDDEHIQNMKAMEWIHDQLDYDSPLEAKCEILYFKESLEIMQQSQPAVYEQLAGCLSNDQKVTLQSNFEKAHARFVESQQQATA